MTAIVGIAEQHRGKAHARMIREGGRHSAYAWVDYKGQRYTAEVPVRLGESEAVALEAAFHEVVRKARAARLTDFSTGQRIN